MGAKREDDAGAKDLKRVLATRDQRCQRAPLQNWRVQTQKPGDHNSESNEVNDPVRREIRLIVGIEWLQDPMRKKTAEIWYTNGRRHDKSKDKVGDRQPERGPCLNDRLKDSSAAKSGPCAQKKQQLPGERIKVPEPRWRGRKIPSKTPGDK